MKIQCVWAMREAVIYEYRTLKVRFLLSPLENASEERKEHFYVYISAFCHWTSSTRYSVLTKETSVVSQLADVLCQSERELWIVHFQTNDSASQLALRSTFLFNPCEKCFGKFSYLLLYQEFD